MVVPGLIHFEFRYHFNGQDEHVHVKDIYASDYESARHRFQEFMLNAPAFTIIDVIVIGQM